MLDLKLKYPDLPVLGRTYRMWGLVDPEAALEHAQALDNEVWNRTGVAAVLAGLGARDPQRVLVVLEIFPDTLGGNHYRNLYHSWVTRAPAEAAASVNGLPEADRETALRTIADNWPGVDRTAALNWFKALPAEAQEIAGPTLDRRIKQLETSISE